MSKHTPGPWKWRATHSTDEEIELMAKHGMTPVQALTNEGQRFLMAGEGEDTKRIALVDPHKSYKRGTGHQVQCDERDANATLLSAAPDLLGFAERVETRISALARVGAIDNDLQCMWAEAREVIAKASA